MSFFVPLFFGLVLTIFSVSVNSNIESNIIPQITTSFDTLDDVGWYGGAYLLAMSAVQPTFGRAYVYFSVKRTYISAMMLFSLGAVLSGSAVNSPMLIVGRVLAGAGSAGVFGGCFIITTFAVSAKMRPIFTAILAHSYNLFSILGPLIGIRLTEVKTWRWCYWMTLPINGLIILLIWLCFQEPESDNAKLVLSRKMKGIDPLGTLLLSGSMVCLFFVISWGGVAYPWSDSLVWGNILGLGLLITLYSVSQIILRTKASIPLHVVSQRSVFCSTAFIFFVSIVFYVHTYALDFYFQTVRSTSIEQSILNTLPYLFSNIVYAMVTAGAISALGIYFPFAWIGAALLAGGSVVIYTLSSKSSPNAWVGAEILAGLGLGCAVQIPFTAVQVVLNSEDARAGLSLVIGTQQLASALASFIVLNSYKDTLWATLPAALPQLDASLIINEDPSCLSNILPMALWPQVLSVLEGAIAKAFTLTFVAVGLAFISGLGLEWKHIRILEEEKRSSTI